MKRVIVRALELGQRIAWLIKTVSIEIRRKRWESKRMMSEEVRREITFDLQSGTSVSRIKCVAKQSRGHVRFRIFTAQIYHKVPAFPVAILQLSIGFPGNLARSNHAIRPTIPEAARAKTAFRYRVAKSAESWFCMGALTGIENIFWCGITDF